VQFVQESAAFFARTGLGEVPQVVVNGYQLKRDELKGEFEETVVSTILRQTGELQKAVYNVSFSIYCFVLYHSM